MYVRCEHAVPSEVRRWRRIPWTGVTVWESNSSPLQEQLVLLGSVPCLQFISIFVAFKLKTKKQKQNFFVVIF